MESRLIEIEKIKERFMSKVLKVESGCWEWQAGKNKCGYGTFRLGGNGSMLAHRASYKIHIGEITEGLCILHSCDNPCCVNPEHLSQGTHQDNMKDMMLKGRRYNSTGIANSNCKLTEDNIRSIRASKDTSTILGIKYSVDRHTIVNIQRGKTWTHVN